MMLRAMTSGRFGMCSMMFLPLWNHGSPAAMMSNEELRIGP